MTSARYKLTAQGFVAADGKPARFIRLQPANACGDWSRKQDASMPEYLSELRSVPDVTQTLYKLFDAYLFAQLRGRRNLKILDVGCGLNRNWPPYMKTLQEEREELGLMYVGLDPIPHDVESRNYPFACARLEDLPSVFDDRFDVFVFATSLDHFEDMDAVARAIGELAAPNALCLFWVGLHDAADVGQQAGARAYRRLFENLNPLVFSFRFMRGIASMAINYGRLLWRARRLRTGRALDQLHFHYFTRDSLAQTLQKFGQPADLVSIPGTCSVFTAVRVHSR